MSKPETRIQELHLMLPPAPRPVAKYKTAVLAGNILYVSGHGPAKLTDKTPMAGKVGRRPDDRAGQGGGPRCRPEHPGHRAPDAGLAGQGQASRQDVGPGQLLAPTSRSSRR